MPSRQTSDPQHPRIISTHAWAFIFMDHSYARVTELRSPYSPSPKGDALAFGHPTAGVAVGYRTSIAEYTEE
jgi:hypothetical protein